MLTRTRIHAHFACQRAGRIFGVTIWIALITVIVAAVIAILGNPAAAATRHYKKHASYHHHRTMTPQGMGDFATIPQVEIRDDRYSNLGPVAPVASGKRDHGRRSPAHARAGGRRVVDANGNYGTVTVQTAAGIPITVSADFAPKITAFIAANVAAGKRFKKIHCLNFASTHVRGSFHFSGNACDFSPHPIGQLAGDYGLRNGCTFMVGRAGHRHPDCEHIDNAYALGFMSRPKVRVARR